MNIKTILFLTLSILSGLISTNTSAALVSVGPYLLDDIAYASGSTLSGGAVESTSGAITDKLVTSYVRGSTTSSAVTLSFENTHIINGTGADLVLFFLTEMNTITMTVGNNNVPAKSYTSSQLFVNPDNPFIDIGEAYGVVRGTEVYALSAIFIDLNDFALSATDVLQNVTIGLGNRQAYLALASGLNFTAEMPVKPVPLPTSLMLFLSGLSGLVLTRRGLTGLSLSSLGLSSLGLSSLGLSSLGRFWSRI